MLRGIMEGKKYTRSEAVNSVAGKTGMAHKAIRAVIDCLLDDLKTALMDKKTIELRGFGTFEVKIRKGRAKARNPKTGEPVSVDSHGIVAFRSGRELKQAVWNLDRRTGVEDGVSSTAGMHDSD